MVLQCDPVVPALRQVDDLPLLDALYAGLERKLALRRLSALLSAALVVTFVAVSWP